MDITFKRLGHLGEVHMVDPDADKTYCGVRCDGPNFSEVAPVDIEPRPSPQLCADCKDVYDARQAEEEEDDSDESSEDDE